MRKIFPWQSADITNEPGEERDDLNFLNILSDSSFRISNSDCVASAY